MKIIRFYASPENSVNVKKLIQDLIVAEFENILDSSRNNLDNQKKNRSSLGGECV
ncbi:hypothetical protein [Bacillus sp. 1NLA3E]|uniref:hypothetical protein n=1 Tax=Bacillus sp. 1NLA3E TaxID=666686 RepID=UPI0002D413F9|nr:hypothetical protein [Bacillus sp. 1NLA3E]